MLQLLREILKKCSDHTEIRYQHNHQTLVHIESSHCRTFKTFDVKGVSFRVFHEGFWGFSATTQLDRKGLTACLKQAQINAQKLLNHHKPIEKNATIFTLNKRPRMTYKNATNLPTSNLLTHQIPINELLGLDHKLRQASPKIIASEVTYQVEDIEKMILTTEGMIWKGREHYPEIALTAYSESKAERASAYQARSCAQTSDIFWQQLDTDQLVEDTVRLSIDLLKAQYVDPGQHCCILAPELVGLLCHEAIGHAVEADFVQSGSFVHKKLNQRIASPLVTIIDSPHPPENDPTGISLDFDDEGIPTQPVAIVEQGILKNFLHNRQTAAQFNAQPCGHARAQYFYDVPLIRMRNTYMKAGTTPLQQLIEELDEGLLVEGYLDGEADILGGFMFGCSHAYQIKKGKKHKLIRGFSLTGQTLEVMKSINGLSKEFKMNLGTGYCDKGQEVKVDAGGPYARCHIYCSGE